MPQPAHIRREEEPLEPLDLQRLYEEHAVFVRSLLGRLLGQAGDADDLAQEVFAIALKRLDKEPIRSPRGWLTQICVNVAATARRRYRIRRFFRFHGEQEDADRLTPEIVAEARERIRRIEAILNRMPEKKRTVFILFEVQGLSGDEIAQALGCPLKTVHTRLFHARREFMQLYREASGSESNGGGDA